MRGLNLISGYLNRSCDQIHVALLQCSFDVASRITACLQYLDVTEEFMFFGQNFLIKPMYVN